MEAIPAPVRAILDLFATELGAVHFADVDAQSLARLAADVDGAAAAVDAAQAALDATRSALHERREALLQQAHRALAYARVYAESDAALSERIDAIALPRPARRPRDGAAEAAAPESELAPVPRRRGRPRKEEQAHATLALE